MFKRLYFKSPTTMIHTLLSELKLQILIQYFLQQTETVNQITK